MAARNRVGLSEQTRLRIKTTMLQERLSDHALGLNEMSTTQVRAAEILLNKTLPNLSAVEMKAEVITQDAKELTESELLNIASSSSDRIVSEEGGEKEPDSFH